MSNKYLNKIAAFDYDAHNALSEAAEKNISQSSSPNGWSGNMDKFKEVSKRRASAISKPAKAAGLMSKLTKFLK